MLKFRPPILEDREWMNPILSASGGIGSEYAFGTVYIWCDAYFTKICHYKDFVLRCSGEKTPFYGFPIGEGDPYPIVEEMIAHAKECGQKFHMWGFTQDGMRELEAAMPGRFAFHPDRANADYVYRTSDLIQLAGRKYHGKRNHLAQFDRSYAWSYEDITEETKADCLAIALQWKDENSETDGTEQELEAIQKAFSAYDTLHLQGGLIRIDGKPVAFTVGEELNSRTYLLHFEKALTGYNSLYTAINHAFAQHHLEPYVYVNREEDLGLEGLRKAKLSYNPAILLEKYVAELK